MVGNGIIDRVATRFSSGGWGRGDWRDCARMVVNGAAPTWASISSTMFSILLLLLLIFLFLFSFDCVYVATCFFINGDN